MRKGTEMLRKFSRHTRLLPLLHYLHSIQPYQFLQSRYRSRCNDLVCVSREEDEFTHFYASKQTIGIILEQEMQLNVIDILLQDVYEVRDNWFQRAHILINRGRLYRASGIECVQDCIKCLSEAIDTIISASGCKLLESFTVSHLLAVAYCLRALCTQEIEPSSKAVFDDIEDAAKIWLSIDILEGASNSLVDNAMFYGYTLHLLSHAVDLLSLKGTMNFHSDICNLSNKVLNHVGNSMEKCLLMLWQSRRLSHALCVSPIDDAVLIRLSEHCGDKLKSPEFWMTCMKDSCYLLLNFKQSFSSLSSQFPQLFNFMKILFYWMMLERLLHA